MSTLGFLDIYCGTVEGERATKRTLLQESIYVPQTFVPLPLLGKFSGTNIDFIIVQCLTLWYLTVLGSTVMWTVVVSSAAYLARSRTVFPASAFIELDLLPRAPLYGEVYMVNKGKWGFRLANKYNRAMNAFKKASKGQEMLGLRPWDAVKLIEYAGDMTKEVPEWNEVVECYKRASCMLRHEGPSLHPMHLQRVPGVYVKLEK
ncbi:gamma-soluble nsf attachment protein [Striga asiatica]|uniref:Gamma-soluble nsf attachment protein n=1 Tax=Striga asiatica TaxID=4170 RepID=A0A5A7QA80_STRAF|nr:gamma-soluble nsf attachment protein [Striga asiatica]